MSAPVAVHFLWLQLANNLPVMVGNSTIISDYLYNQLWPLATMSLISYESEQTNIDNLR